MLKMINKTKTKLCRRKVNRLQEGLLKFYHLEDKVVSLVVIGDGKMRKLNRDFRGIDKITDVLAFPIKSELNFEEEENLLGEIFINIQEARRTDKYVEIFGKKKSYQYIFYFLFIHGLLHLIGYDDKQEKGRLAMIELGIKFMNKYYR
jgi:probable rRNA maturation factor